jgi:hypothetical protein
MKQYTLVQHLELVVIHEENLTNANGNLVILDVYLIMKGDKKKDNHHARGIEQGEEFQYYKKNPTSWRTSVFGTIRIMIKS